MASKMPSKYDMNALGHFNMELFYFSEIIESFSVNSPQIDQSSVEYLTKILHSVANLLGNDHMKKVYDSNVKIVPEAFQQVTLQRLLICHTCNEEIPFLWQLFRQHKCSKHEKKEQKTKSKLDQLLKYTNDHNSKQKDLMLSFASFEQELMDALDDMETSSSGTESDEVALKQELKKMRKEQKVKRRMIAEKRKERKHQRRAKMNPDKKVYTMNKNMKEFLSNDPVKVMQTCRESADTIKQTSAHGSIVEALEDLLRKEFPLVKVYAFGSRIAGLGHSTSDLDLFVDVNNYYNNPLTDKEKIIEIMKQVEKLLKSSGAWRKLLPIKNARVPILKAHNLTHGIPCDLSFSSGLSGMNTRLIAYFLKLQPDCHNVACFLKPWSLIGFPKHKNRISSYLGALLVIFYMQTIKLLPSVWDLQDKSYPMMIGDWRSNFHETLLSGFGLEESANPLKILIGFFEFYSKFDYQQFVICPFLGRPIEKTLFDAPEQLPDEMIHYKTYVQKLPPSEENLAKLLNTNSRMCVQDPFELCHNVAKCIDAHLFVNFKQFCEQSCKLLQANQEVYRPLPE
ncbi:hypothetical protein DMENIID0001_131080 [Sergentomyia squamirostris]